MDCKVCNNRMIKTSDFTYDEILDFINGEKEFYSLILVEKEKNLFGHIEVKKSLNFRKIKEINKNKIKLYGLASPLTDGKVSINIDNFKITYSIIEITDEVVKIIKSYVEQTGKKYFSNTKLNNYLWKKSSLKRLCEVEKIELNKSEEFVDLDKEFPF